MAAPLQHAGRLIAIVVTCNRLEQLRATLTRLLDTPHEDLSGVVVFDNASSDGTASFLASIDDPRLDVIRSRENVGGAGGFEAAMRKAMQDHAPDWMVLMDDDARPYPGAITAFHAEDRSQAEAWAGAVYEPDGTICDMNRPSLNPFWRRQVFLRTLFGRGRDGFHLGESAYRSTKPTEIDGTSFVGFFVSAQMVARVGFPDGRLFLYGDDVLYTLGIRAAGGRILFDPSVRFEHDFASIGRGDKRFNPLWKCYYHYRNLLMIYRLCSGVWFVFVGPAAALKWLAKVRYYRGQRRVFLKLVFRALRDGVMGYRDIPVSQVQTWAEETVGPRRSAAFQNAAVVTPEQNQPHSGTD